MRIVCIIIYGSGGVQMFNIKAVLSAFLVSVMTCSSAPDLMVRADETFESGKEAVASIGAGWNLGNTLDSYGTWINAPAGDYKAYETAWQNPVTSKAMIDSVRDQGFNAIRIPVTWSQHIDGKGKVDKKWMERVKEVVDYAYDDGLYVILNVHHDTGEGGSDKVSWIFAEGSTYKKTRKKFAGLWTEIANEFKDYGGRLLFEGYNEMLDKKNTWNAPSSSSSYGPVNDYAQLFVDTVRATGGNNVQRNLIVNTYVASIDQAVLDNFKIPSDSASGHLIAEVHCYSPWGFTGTSKSVTWTSVHKDFGDADRSEIDGIMGRLKSWSDKNNVAVIIGEFGAEFKENEDQIASYASYFVDAAGKAGIKCFYWDNGDFKTSGEGGYAIFDRKAMSWKTSISSAIVGAAGKYAEAPAQSEPTEPAETEVTTEVTEETAATEETSATPETTETTETTVTAGTSAAAATTAPAQVQQEDKFTLVPFIVIDSILVAAAVALAVCYIRKKNRSNG